MRAAGLLPTSRVMGARLVGAILVAVGAVVAAGCGGSGGSSSVVSGEPISFQELSRSASTSADAKSGRFSFDMSMTFPGTDEPFAFSGEGAFDRASQRSSFAVDMSSLAKLLGGLFAGLAGPNAQDAPDFDDPAGWKIEVIQDGDVGYVRFPAMDDKLPDGKSWIRAEEGQSAGGVEFHEFEQFAQSDPRDLLTALHAVTSDIETVGTEQLHGVDTTHYRAVVDPAQLAMKAPGVDQAKTQSLVDQLAAQSGIADVPVDVWIDSAGLVRKLSMALTATNPASSQSSDASLAFEIWDYNEPVEIALPPASEVVDASAVHG